MSRDDVPKAFEHIVLLAVEGLGLGRTIEQGSEAIAADSLQHLWAYQGPLELPFLRWLGLGKLHDLPGLRSDSPPAASFGVLPPPMAPGDSATRELRQTFETAGVTLSYYPDGGAQTLPTRLERLLGQLDSSGTGCAVHLFEMKLDGERGGPIAAARNLGRLDDVLGALQPVLSDEHLLFVFGMYGHDSVARPGQLGTSECRPLLAYTPAAPSGIGLGLRGGLRDVVATALEALGIKSGDADSFFRPLLA